MNAANLRPLADIINDLFLAAQPRRPALSQVAERLNPETVAGGWIPTTKTEDR